MPTAKKRATVKDVAELAGVSWKTVTNVMHGRRNVRESTREKVMAAAEELDYRASLAGRQLRTGRTGTIALAIPEVGVSYFAQLADLFIKEGDRRGLTVFIYDTFQVPARERIAAQGFEVAFADGVVLNPVALRTEEFARLAMTVPLVVLGESVEGAVADHIAIDNVGSAHELTEHLLDSGRQRIFFVGSEPGHTEGTGGLRQSGWAKALRERGVDPRPEWVFPTESYSLECGSDVVDALLNITPPPDAVVCGNDDLALGVIYGLRKRGLSVPSDVAVAGWDDAPMGRYSNPSLTTVKPDLDSLVQEAFNSVLARIEGKVPEPREIVIRHSIVIRESTSRRRTTEDDGCTSSKGCDQG